MVMHKAGLVSTRRRGMRIKVSSHVCLLRARNRSSERIAMAFVRSRPTYSAVPKKYMMVTVLLEWSEKDTGEEMMIATSDFWFNGRTH